MRRRLAVAVLILGASGPAFAQRWEAPRASGYQALSIVAVRVVSNEVNSVVDALACRNGRSTIIRAGTGGEPPEGPTQLRVGGRTVILNFSRDPSIQRLIGVPGAWAPLPTDVLALFRDAVDYRYAFARTPVRLTGVRPLLNAAAQACGFASAAVAGSTSLAQSGGVSADELRQRFIGRTITHQVPGGENWQFLYKPDGTYEAHNGRVADGGRYTIRPDGTLCWTRSAGITGCFQYYRLGGRLRVRAQNGDIGAVTIGR